MIPDVSKALSWLEAHPQALNGIQRGIERETLRITSDGHLATTPHPKSLGSALTHRWITTDFAEALLEFITPVDGNVDHLLAFLRDIHRHVSRDLGSELMWPLSMPCFISSEDKIELAQYGTSNVGRFKTLYREGLKNRYGALMQTISGVHYNFSLPLEFWQAREGITDAESGKEKISEGYFRLIRNYYRYGWVIPYLFGASPALCSSFIKGRENKMPFEKLKSGACYLPYATSLRMSDLGYTNTAQSNLGITFNNLTTYVEGLKKAISIPAEQFKHLDEKSNGHYQQINSNVLQIENEFYAPIRPKRVTRKGESPSDALLRGGVEYIEVRALDINPFSPIGIDADQARFLDLFLIWCTLADAPEMSSEELQCTRHNWNRVILEGRKPGQTIGIGCDTARQPLEVVGKSLFADLLRVAEVLDGSNKNSQYQDVCNKLISAFEDPELTFSGRMLQAIKDVGIGSFGLALAEQYRQMLQSEPLSVLTEDAMESERVASLRRQQEMEQRDTMSFDEYLAEQNQR
ncbi:glutamate--cysteine ligase [Limnobaculum xujianqingii]|uniref:glutamate--cysteine ligase n=1 Tax=Limnobaculum xujianqingii TaxID=2738837 RepID=UPI001129BE90|nr:glutamate--cysteine ligase [Limnobaculum xujianqingii]